MPAALTSASAIAHRPERPGRHLRAAPAPTRPASPARSSAATTPSWSSQTHRWSTGTYTVAVIVQRRARRTGRSTSTRTHRSSPTEAPPTTPPCSGSPTAFRVDDTVPFRRLTASATRITRLPAGQQVRIQIAGAAGPSRRRHGGQRQLHDRRAGRRPVTSPPSTAPASQPAGVDAQLPRRRGDRQPGRGAARSRARCASTRTPMPHLIIDVNGYVAPSATSRFVPVDPQAPRSTPRSAHRCNPGACCGVVVDRRRQPRAARQSTAVALNLTADRRRRRRLDPGVPVRRRRARRLERQRAAAVASAPTRSSSPTAADGSICLTVQRHHARDRRRHRVVRSRTTRPPFVPLSPMRLADTRSYQAQLNPAADAQPLAAGAVLRVQVAGNRGIPAGVKAASVNLVALDSPFRWLARVPSRAAPRPTCRTSTISTPHRSPTAPT